MELGEAEAVGLLHDHDRRVRDVDADLDHRRRDEDVELARLEARHHAPPLGRPQAPVQAADAVAAELGRAEPLGLLLGGARDAASRTPRSSGQTTYACRPSSRWRQRREYASELRSSVTHAVIDRLAVGRRQRELAHLEVAVDRERERSRDRRRGEVEDVRAAALDERGPLRDPEPVLLVDDGDREIGEVDLLLDERVRPDDDLRIARGDELPRCRVLLRAKRAREERDADAERRAQLVDR